jgi:hypothetical protein
VRVIGYVAFGVFVLVLAALMTLAVSATWSYEDKDPPDVAARKAECRKLSRHLIEISPESKGKSIDELVAKVPIEDIELCGAAYPESVACMQAAPDPAAVKPCIPVPVDCDGKDAEVAGTSPVYEVTGECKTVRVKTTHARVVFKTVPAKVEITGSDNKVELAPPGDKPAPQVSDQGARNTVTTKEEK